jgi:hypothetical protein
VLGLVITGPAGRCGRLDRCCPEDARLLPQGDRPPPRTIN